METLRGIVHPLAAERIGTARDGHPIHARTDVPVTADAPDLNRRVAEFLLHQNEITSRFVDAMMAKGTPAMNAAANGLSDWKPPTRTSPTTSPNTEATPASNPPPPWPRP